MIRRFLSVGTSFRYADGRCNYNGQEATVLSEPYDNTSSGGIRRAHEACMVEVLPAAWVEKQACRETSHPVEITPPPAQAGTVDIVNHALHKLHGDLKAGRGDRKAPLMWIPLWAMTGVARVFAYGARKYAPGNWQKAAADGASALEDYLSAFQRHWAAIQEADPGGVAKWDSLDEESGLPHLDHAICSLVMLRGIAILAKILPRDPGRGLDPVKIGDTGGKKP